MDTFSKSDPGMAAAIFSFIIYLIKFSFLVCHASIVSDLTSLMPIYTTHCSAERVQFHAAIIKSLRHASYRFHGKYQRALRGRVTPGVFTDTIQQPSEKMCPRGQPADFQSSLFPIRAANHRRVIDTRCW